MPIVFPSPLMPIPWKEPGEPASEAVSFAIPGAVELLQPEAGLVKTYATLAPPDASRATIVLPSLLIWTCSPRDWAAHPGHCSPGTVSFAISENATPAPAFQPLAGLTKTYTAPKLLEPLFARYAPTAMTLPSLE